MKTLLIIHHSMTDGTRQMAQAALEGAMGESNIAVVGMHAAEAAPEDLLEADGYIFATPENLASMAGVMKDFFDRCYYPLLDQIQGRPYATMICAGSDGTGAARQIARIATGWRLKPIAEPLIIITGAQTPEAIAAPKIIGAEELARCEELGAAFAAGLASGIF
ncbi:MAG: NAD(P)H-dependent oxidoreductase [Roseomonas sp.]|jgi:multimeric flavodoxin WrbA|nr:NAD(P)H-dependent oxidoreductase [Roseomonas sp.]MCA3283270.1 NAD(P)H-dependent oxidoreductase [Roseomonas sp.]MCA3298428.1 NAD(P)H-dependent oxidoreductase [Roseomonas sp.]